MSTILKCHPEVTKVHIMDLALITNLNFITLITNTKETGNFYSAFTLS